MSDLVERLKARERVIRTTEGFFGFTVSETDAECIEAANEIERLRAELAQGETE